jgi:transposase
VAPVMIGIDPHKASHTAVALDGQEVALGQLRVRSGPDQLRLLLEWAQASPVSSCDISGTEPRSGNRG